jgi:hypothetical protein
MTLEWVGLVPGKRESRRFVGEYTLDQKDIIEQRHHDDTVAFGGWAIDLHPAEGVYSTHNGCMQYHSKGIYEIPYRCFVSKDIKNLFFAGRCISASHVAHGSSRVMATSGLGGQAVGMAAAQCLSDGLLPVELIAATHMHKLQQKLNLAGQSIPLVPIDVNGNLAAKAKVSASSELSLSEIPFDGPWYTLDYSTAQLLPLEPGIPYKFEVEVDASEETNLTVELRYAEKAKNYTPDIIAETVKFNLRKGTQKVNIDLTKNLPCQQYAFVTFMRNDKIRLRMSEMRCTGLLSVFNKFNYASIASTRRFNQSAEINLYTNCPEYLINNKWFRLCIGYITKVHKIDLINEYNGNKISRMMHQADIHRLKILIENGGIYLDLDMITLKSYYHLLDESRTIYEPEIEYKSEDTIIGLNNCIILTPPQSPFLIEALKLFDNFKDDNHIGSTSIAGPYELYNNDSLDLKTSVKIVEPKRLTGVDYQGWDPVHLFNHYRPKLLKDSFALHLWENLWHEKWLFPITVEHIRTINTTFTSILKPYFDSIDYEY